jgi:pyruvate/2-oxoglutarate dehydrogenase complex dihydrolipoamide acyltransferase (E2) component
MIYGLMIPTTFEDNDAVRVLEWHCAPGDRLEPGAMLVELETHKALIEVRAGQPGVLRAIRFTEGEWCPLGGELALLSDGAEEPLDPATAQWDAEFTVG